MSNVELLIVTAIEILCILLLWATIEPRLLENKYKLVSVLVLLTVSTNIISQYDVGNAAAIRLALSILIVWAIIRLPFIDLFVSYFTSIILVGIAQLAVIAFLSIAKVDSASMDFQMTLAANILLLGCSYAIYQFVPMRGLQSLVAKNRKVIFYATLNLIFLLFIIIVVWDSDKAYMMDSIFMISVSFLLWSIINIVMVVQHLAYNNQKRKLQVHEEYMPIIDGLVDEVRSIQHDHHHHLHTMYGLAEVSSSETLKDDMIAYLERIINVNKQSNRLINMENKFVAALLYTKIKDAKSKDVMIDIKIRRQGKLDMPSYELVEVLGNLIDNAIEASQKSKEMYRENVIVAFNADDKFGYITVSNKIPKGSSVNIGKMFKNGFTTKEEAGHGYGLRKVANLITASNGSYEVNVQDSRISIRCKLPLKKNELFND